MHSVNLKVWGVSVLLAVLVHGVVLFSWSEYEPVIRGSGNASVNSLRLSFKQTNESDQVIQKKIKSEPVKKQLVKPASKLESKLLAENLEFEKIVKETIQNSSEEPNSRVVDSESENDILLIKKNRLNYFNQLISHIEKFKFYPGSARRRGIEGKVSICFDLNSDGSISSLMVESKHRVLKHAAEQAIKSALPMPLPDKRVTLGRKIDFNMLYAMK